MKARGRGCYGVVGGGQNGEWMERVQKKRKRQKQEGSGDVCPENFNGRNHFDKERDKGEDKDLSKTLPALDHFQNSYENPKFTGYLLLFLQYIF